MPGWIEPRAMDRQRTPTDQRRHPGAGTNRRSFLVACAAAVAATVALAGCGEAGPAATTTETTGSTDSPTPTAAATTTASVTPAVTETPAATTTAPSGAVTSSPTDGGEVVDVSAGPEGRLRFRPETVEISVGDTVRWTFESPGHNVTTLSGASEKVSIPENAEPFASYEGDQHFAIREVGTTYEHTFTVAGEYVYVCAPHADQGMVGTVVVSA